jgi:hypothetical protein
MMNFMNNYKSIIRDNARTEIRFVNELSKVPGVDKNSIRSNWEFRKEKDSFIGTTIGKKELNISFSWHDYTISIITHCDETISIYENDRELGTVYWSVEYGYLASRYANPIEMKKWEIYLVDTLLKIVGRVGRCTEHIEYRTECTYNGYEIIADRARLVVKNIKTDKMTDIIGHTITGGNWWSTDNEFADIIRFIKKNFVRK